ncbi:hypothetical protein CLV40_12937 [Actinokineospora auranticolor]|uniref:Uncharacterized protein n=1 Tax=Actinokineospora auranticolor TaxID=155976 RepID=A0A2S6GDM0_9PSEU|nr:hypothetical protein CLV40_12937 [Actinokineospora auranticolor]
MGHVSQGPEEVTVGSGWLGRGGELGRQGGEERGDALYRFGGEACMRGHAAGDGVGGQAEVVEVGEDSAGVAKAWLVGLAVVPGEHQLVKVLLEGLVCGTRQPGGQVDRSDLACPVLNRGVSVFPHADGRRCRSLGCAKGLECRSVCQDGARGLRAAAEAEVGGTARERVQQAVEPIRSSSVNSTGGAPVRRCCVSSHCATSRRPAWWVSGETGCGSHAAASDRGIVMAAPLLLARRVEVTRVGDETDSSRVPCGVTRGVPARADRPCWRCR